MFSGSCVRPHFHSMSSNLHGPIHDSYYNLDITGIFAGLAFQLLCTKAGMVSENKVKLFIVSQKQVSNK